MVLKHSKVVGIMYVLDILNFINLTCHFFYKYVDDENFDEFMKEIGVGWAMRMAAKAVKPRLVISENNGKWNIKSESTFKTLSIDFTPGVAFDEITPDGREVTVRIDFNIEYEFLIDFLLFRQLSHLKVING